MSKIYRGICKIDDERNNGQLKPKGNIIEMGMTLDDPRYGCDSGFGLDLSEENTVHIHHQDINQNGCFISFTRDEAMAANFATTGNQAEGYVYVEMNLC